MLPIVYLDRLEWSARGLSQFGECFMAESDDQFESETPLWVLLGNYGS